MKGWFTEFHTPNVGITIRIKAHLYDGRTRYQKIDVIDTPEFGRILLLDNLIMISERDEHVYHEMMSHPPLLTHKAPKKVLVIGGGDGGVLREILKHPYIQRIDQAEVDEEVIKISRKFFPKVASAYDNPKVNVYIADGFEFVKKKSQEYDIIIVDSTDPFGPGKVLFSMKFYRRVCKALCDDGIMTAQVGTPFYNANHVKKTFQKLRRVFPIVRPYMAHIPTYTDGYYCLAFCSKRYDPLKTFGRFSKFAARRRSHKRYSQLAIAFKYYNDNLHTGAFLLPTYVANLIQ